MMSDEVVEILLVEDNPNDEELMLHAFRRYQLTNRLQVVRTLEMYWLPLNKPPIVD